MGLNDVPDTIAELPWLLPGDKVVCVSQWAKGLGLESNRVYTVDARSSDGLIFLVELPDDTMGFLGESLFKKV